MFDDITLDTLDAIADWMDDDDEPNTLGVERDYYLSLESPYEPRNGPIHTLGEMELIAGIWPRYFRGEDWNLNGRLDPNENDGSRSFPPDEPDGILESGWSGHLTPYSVLGAATDSGEPRMRLRDADPKELAQRCDITDAQANALISFGTNDTNQLSDLLFTPLNQAAGAQTGNPQAQPGQQNQDPKPSGNQSPDQTGPNATTPTATGGGQAATPLTDEQLRSVLAECAVEDPKTRKPGKMNLNTVPSDFLRDIFQLLGIDEAIADEVLYMRDRPEGIGSLVDLKKIPSITTEDMRNITRRFDVVSSVFTVSSRGRSEVSGVEVEIVAVVDRSTIPVRIIEYREQ